MENLSPKPEFPFAIENLMPLLPQATTPLVLVVRPPAGMRRSV
ncbi:MAG TPA: hypothetical protein VHM02_02365 [Thermoanaerobaculia bacterium]|nr:hypothetical protein [Thermoanaerobaculia bacterium]